MTNGFNASFTRERHEARALLDRLLRGDLVLAEPEIYDKARLTVEGVTQTLAPFHAAEPDVVATAVLRGVLASFVESKP